MDKHGQSRETALVLRDRQSAIVRDRAREGEFQGLWFRLARSNWTSLVLVPADEGLSAAGVATALADVGRRLRNTPVTFLVMAGSIDYASAGKFVSAVTGQQGAADGPPSSRVIVAVPSVIEQPLALAVTDAADAVAVVMRTGGTAKESAERTIELVGRDRILGCVLA